MTNHTTRLRRRSPNGVELVSHDPAVRHKAFQAHANGTILDFVFWNGKEDEIVEGKVVACQQGEPFTFSIERDVSAGLSRSAETARQERQQGGQPRASSSGDPVVNAAGPHDTAALASGATEGGGMLSVAGAASEDDMAPGG